jgi:hypothetical protein
MRGHSARRVSFLLGTTLCLVVGIGAWAVADPWGSQDGDTGAHPDSNPHTYCFGTPLSADLKPNIDNAAENALEPTDATVNFEAACDLSDTDGDRQTDVRWRQGDLAGGTTGLAPCAVYLSNGHCDRYDITIDYAQVQQGENDERDQTQTACHEQGHSVGLSHASNDCMMSGEPPEDIAYRRYSGHHIDDHINPWFS